MNTLFIMEELQSTEALDREILEDARKKALRIMKTSEDTARTQTAEWERKAAKNIEDLEKKYDEQRELAAEKIMARLPVDKHRIKAEKLESLISSAVELWYKGLSRARIIELLAVELAKKLALCEETSSSEQKRAFYSGLDQKETEEILKNAGTAASVEEVKTGDSYPFIILETENARITVSVRKMVDFLLQEKRAELAGALLGGDFIGDI